MDNIKDRCAELIAQGNLFKNKIKYDEDGHPDFHFNQLYVPELRRWIASVTTIINFASEKSSYFNNEVNKIVNDEELRYAVPFYTVQNLIGILTSFNEELELGFLNKLEMMIVSLTYDNFLDQAEDFHKGGMKNESSILASVIFENTIRKIATKNGMKEEGNSIENIINELTKLNVFTGVKSKRIKSFASVRNEALHTHWDKFDIRDVGEMIKGIRELIETKLEV